MSILKPKNWIFSLALISASSNVAMAQVPAFPATDLDRSANPNVDFDQFANGGWKAANPIPGTESRWGAFGILDKENREVRLKNIISELLNTPKNKPGSESQQIADFYRSYMDTELIEKLGTQPIKPYLDIIAKAKNIKEWNSTNAHLANIGIFSVFGFGVNADRKNSKLNAVYLYQSGLTLGEKGFYTKTDSSSLAIRKEMVQHIDEMFRLAGWKDKSPGAAILKFETEVAGFQLSNVELRDPEKTYNKIGKNDLASLQTNLDLTNYLKIIAYNFDEVIVQHPDYIKNLNKFLATQNLETLKTYQRWLLLNSFATALPNKFQQESFRFNNTVLKGVKERKPLEDRAIEATNNILGMPLGKLFAAKYFPESSKKKVAEMIENVRTVFGERIDGLSWMSANTKIEARKKLAEFTYKIGYPDTWKDYSTIEIKPNALVANIIAARQWRVNEARNKIGKEVDKTEWGMSPQTVNAYYSPMNNEIVFPAGILQPPFFNPDADDAINYGGIIAVIGHEFSHGFDDKGSKYNAEGNLSNWWTEDDRTAFDALANKYIEYFDHKEVLPGLNINGKLTIGENIADLGGLTLAYYALKKSIDKNGAPAPIDGFTWQQRFFLGWAQVWHTNITEKALRQQVLTDPHSPAKERINGPMPHLKEFQEAWQTKPGDALYLDEASRIVIW
ncbi:MAG: endothelin-converting protein [Bacteroidetes bacterium 43-16]|nr:MAG: endothelin-converting protein [Bacteroidetes bacterium 43-16]